MKKNIRVTIKINDSIIEFITTAIYTSDYGEVKYIENRELKTIVKFNFLNNKLKRSNKEMDLEYTFSNVDTIGKLFIKDINKKIEVKVKTKKIIKENGNLELEFQVEEENIIYKIEVI